MPDFVNPAVTAFVDAMGDEFVLAEVLIRKNQNGFDLRHVEDQIPDRALRVLRLAELRELAQFTAGGAFRPLKSAPTLRKGWTIRLQSATDLESALNQLYPGALADWYAIRSGRARVTHFREFTDRQSGMYRITQKLTDEQAAMAIRAGCNRSVCLKHRLWTVINLDPDAVSSKSAIPCLEPCPLLLEFLRVAARLEQQGMAEFDLPRSERTARLATLRQTLTQPDLSIGDADFENSRNLRRVWLTIEKIEASLDGTSSNALDAPESDLN